MLWIVDILILKTILPCVMECFYSETEKKKFLKHFLYDAPYCIKYILHIHTFTPTLS